ncbi:porin family protein [Vibrio sp. S9_S30]|uniref:outer membrane beta-barrel protein n=1 Tax=Vibrio sp. S9_S30 TaxID=2720226 RepID=UPI00168154C8|nr:outer membrane beta-barrel protein [Vibrio sp. S9_S30]MBD1558066.1 porin family protein [Vibrio sp. S9_S30]
MKKSYCGLVLIVGLMSGFASAQGVNRLEGWSLGAGYSDTEYSGSLGGSSISGDAGSGLRLETTYNFNGVAALKGSYERNSRDELKGHTLKIGGELGHSYVFSDGSFIKPYIELGYANHRIEGTTTRQKVNESAAFGGAGIRLSTNYGFYVDFGADRSKMNGVNVTQMSATFGMKF